MDTLRAKNRCDRAVVSKSNQGRNERVVEWWSGGVVKEMRSGVVRWVLRD